MYIRYIIYIYICLERAKIHQEATLFNCFLKEILTNCNKYVVTKFY